MGHKANGVNGDDEEDDLGSGALDIQKLNL
jgi:hypothetical protein